MSPVFIHNIESAILHSSSSDSSSFVLFLHLLLFGRNAHDQLGLLFKETELYERAMEEYKLALLYGPVAPLINPAREHLAVVLTDYGTRLKLQGATDKAVQAYTEALQIHDAYWPAYFNLVRATHTRTQTGK